MKKQNYFKRLIDEKDPASSRRFLGLLMSVFLVISGFYLLFSKTFVPNQDLLHTILLYAFFIVLMSLFGLAVTTVSNTLLQVSKARAAAQILTPQPTVTQVDVVEGDVNGSIADDKPETDEELLKDLKNTLK